MESLLKNKCKLILIILVVIYVIHFSIVSFLKYKFFIYSDFDLSVHSQALWNTMHGSTESSILGKSFLGNHAHFIQFLILPIFFLFPSPVTLLILQTIFLGAGAVVVFLIAKRLLDDSWALLIGFIYLIYPGLIFANLYEFHPTAFAVVFLLLMIYFYLKQKIIPMAIFGLLALLCQENVSLIICAFLIFSLFNKENHAKRHILIVFAIFSFLWFLTCIYIIMPFYAKEKIQYFQMFYSHVGGSPGKIIIFLFTHPIKALHILFTGDKLKYLCELFGPLSFFSIFPSEFFFAIFPALLQHLLSRRIPEHTIQFHYALEMIPFIFVAAIFGIKQFFIRARFRFKQNFIKIIVLIVALFFYLNTGATYYLFRLKDYQYNYYTQKQKLIEAIPKDAAVIATFSFQPKLSLRRNLYSFHSVLLAHQPYSRKEFILPANTQFALIDFIDILTFRDFYIEGSEQKIQAFLNDTSWGIRDVEDSVVLFQKDLKSERYLYKVLTASEIPQISLDVTINNELKIYGMDILKDSSNQSMSFDLFWQALKNINSDISIFFDFIDSKDRVCARIFRPICYRILPTYVWQRSLRIKEYRNIIFPPGLIKGRYSIKVGFNYNQTYKQLSVQGLKQDIDEFGRFHLIDVDIN